MPRVPAAVLGLVLLGVTGCVSMPASGPPARYPNGGGSAAQNLDYNIAPFPAAPGQDWAPAEIVQGFLVASASYATNPALAREYLTPDAIKTWQPQGSATVFSSEQEPQLVSGGLGHATHATVNVTGSVLATLAGSGQLVYQPAQSGTASGSGRDQCGQPGPGSSCYQFTLVKGGSGWRIQTLPTNLLFDEEDFNRVYRSQDVYFFSQSTPSRLVPDAVYVPLGTSVNQLLSTLVRSVVIDGPPAWLHGAVSNSFPPGTTVRSVSAEGVTAVVDLGGTIARHREDWDHASAQLALTLSGLPGAQGAINAIKLEINGSSWQAPQPVSLYRATYDPYQGRQAIFSYTDGSGLAFSRCGSVQNGAAGPAVPLFGVAHAVMFASCAPTAAPSPSAAASVVSGRPKAKKQVQNPLSMTLISPDGKYLAGVATDRNGLTVWPLHATGGLGSTTAAGAAPAGVAPAGVAGTGVAAAVGAGVAGAGVPAAVGAGKSWPLPQITSMSWDQQDDLWVTAQNGAVWVLPPNGKPYQLAAAFASAVGSGEANVTALAVAPDGVRVAAIVNGGLELAAIMPNQQQPSQGQRPQAFSGPSLGLAVQIDPSVTNVTALSWYDADDLIVIGGQQPALVREVAVNGRSTNGQTASLTMPPQTSPVSVAAETAANLILVGLSNGQLEAAATLTGTWQPVGSPGEGDARPAYSWLNPSP